MSSIFFADSISWENQGEPMLRAVDQLRSNSTWAESMGVAAQQLVTTVLHPDNVERYVVYQQQFPKICTADQLEVSNAY